MNARKLLDWLFGWQKNAGEVDTSQVHAVKQRPHSQREGMIQEYSDTWVYVANWAEAELQRTRERNDSHKRDAIQTAALRGRIDMLKELIELPRPKERRTRSSEQQED